MRRHKKTCPCKLIAGTGIITCGATRLDTKCILSRIPSYADSDNGSHPVSHTLLKKHFRSPSKVHSPLHYLLRSHHPQLSPQEEAVPTTLSQRFIQRILLKKFLLSSNF